MLTISDLISELDILLRVDDDLLLAVNRDDLGRTVGIARVVDQTPTTVVSTALVSE